MWLVQLQRHGNDFLRMPSTSRIVCGCDTEEAAIQAGTLLCRMKNYPDYGMTDIHGLGIVLGSPHPDLYHFAVKEHKGEWV